MKASSQFFGLKAQEWTQVIRGVWIGTLVYSALILVVSVALSEEALDNGALAWIPECPAKAAGGRCWACGLTHSLVSAGDCHFSESFRYNPLGIPIFTVSGANIVVALGVFLKPYIRYSVPKRKRNLSPEETTWV